MLIRWESGGGAVYMAIHCTFCSFSVNLKTFFKKVYFFFNLLIIAKNWKHPDVLQWVNGYINCDTSVTWNSTQQQEETSYCYMQLKKKMWKSVMSDSLQPHGLYSPWNSPGQNTGVASLSLLQGVFPTNPGVKHLDESKRNSAVWEKPISKSNILRVSLKYTLP